MSTEVLLAAFSVLFLWNAWLSLQVISYKGKVNSIVDLKKNFDDMELRINSRLKEMEERVTTDLHNFDTRQGAFMRTYIDELKSYFKDIKIK